MKYNETMIGQRIKEERENLGFSQGELAEACNLSMNSRQTIAKWESGKQLPPTNDLLKLCELFKCELGYLLCEADYAKGYKSRTATELYEKTGLSEPAVENLCIAADGLMSGPIDKRLANARHDNLRSLEIGRFAKIRLLELLLENSDIWERMAVCAYDFREQMHLFEIDHNHSINGIRHDQFANVAKESAKEALTELFSKIEWDELKEEEWGDTNGTNYKAYWKKW